jgi:hypothetical protein
MRVLPVLVAGFVAAPVASQTAVTMDFTRSEPSVSGTQVRASSGFTEFRLGIWEKPQPAGLPVTTDNSRAEPADFFDLPEEGPVATPSADGDRPLSSSVDRLDPCAGLQVPRYIPGLSTELVRRRLTWWPLVSASECRYGIPAGLLDAVILQESRYQIGAISPKGAIGLAQLMPGTARELGVANANDPLGNIDGGARYLRQQLDRFDAVHLGVAAYNAGPGAVRAAGRIPRNGETPDYVRRVLDYWSGAIDYPMTQIRRTAQRLGFSNGENQ